MFEEGIYQEIKNVIEIWDACQEKITAIGALAIPVLTLRQLMSYIYDISSLKVNNLTLILLTWRKWWAPNNASI